MRTIILGLALVIAAIGPARAEVVGSSPAHFEARFTQTVAKPPAEVWRALGRIGRWWDDEHTFSGAARNMRMALHAGGCFCEAWDGASIEHARVIYAKPGEMLRLQGGLGPLQELGLTGIMTFALAPGEGGTALTLTYRVTGAGTDLAPLAPLVDGVIGQQFARLVRYAETGAPG
jgi:uncharacterized protein YndB with AHSA1/START domain